VPPGGGSRAPRRAEGAHPFTKSLAELAIGVGGRVAHGYLIVSFAAGLFVWPDCGPVLAKYGIDSLRFLTPLKP
jgi:acyl dehydratase